MLIAASLIVSATPAAAVATPDPVAEAVSLYGQGRTLTARTVLEQALAAPQGRDPARRLNLLATLLDICLRTEAAECVRTRMQDYLDAANASTPSNDILRREQVRQTGYYLDYGRSLIGSPQVVGKILDGELWRQENPANIALYLQRQGLAANIALTLNRPADAVRSVDKALSLIASLKAPQANRFVVAATLSDAISVLLDVGQAERALGLYRAGLGLMARALPPKSFEAALFRLREAQVLQQAGDLGGAGRALDAAIAGFSAAELDPGVQQFYLAQALTLKAAICGLKNDRACAAEALARHPYGALYAVAGRRPGGAGEVSYLAARAFVGALDGKADPIAAEALAAPIPTPNDPHIAATVELDRRAGLAFAAPAGEARRAALASLGAQAKAVADQRNGVFGAWYRPDAADRVLIAAALMDADAPDADNDTLFALFQLAARSGAAFDADALTALSQAKGPLERRSVHQALRLLARRDRYEQQRIQAVAAQAFAPAPPSSPFEHDAAIRLRLRGFADQIGQAQQALDKDGVATSGANLTPLTRFQALLGPHEAALAVAEAPGGLAYLCVRRDRVVHSRGPADFAQVRLDTRLLQAALTATYAPDETLDSQFPAAAAVRLYGVFIRPFEGCLQAGDHILWLSPVASLNLPLVVLLPKAPPALGKGYDLARADWLVLSHPVSYAGSAAMVAAARSGAARRPADFDFLGVGDPRLDSPTAKSSPRAADIAALPPLPETRAELQASAQGFARTRLLLGAGASEAAFRRELVGDYRYLSFATHGLVRDDIEALSEPALVLTPGATDSPADDGLLTASEIADLNLQARFVALSACNTANFDLTKASQDLPALASAFAVAGVPATLATLWPVNSEAGRRVVAPTFAALRANAEPALALAQAQRAFLAAPPGRAYLHPRFWAPFVILGDGGAPAPDAPAGETPRIAAVEPITPRSGEVIALLRTPRGLAARYIGDPDAKGRHASGVRLAAPDGHELWRTESASIGATRVLAEHGGRLIAGGYQSLPGAVVPTLEAFDAAGRRAETWRGDTLDGRDAVLVAGGALDARRSVFAVVDPNFRAAAPRAPRQVHLLSLDGGLPPKPLADLDLPDGLIASEATVTRSGDTLLVSYGNPAAVLRPPAFTEDDFDTPLCLSQPRTRVELRDARTGAARAALDLPGYSFTAAVRLGDRVVLGGLHSQGCGTQNHAVVVWLDARLQLHTLYEDASLGLSWVRALAPLTDGRLLVVGAKESVLDAAAADPTADPYAAAPQSAESGLLLVLAADGSVSAPVMLDTGGNVFLSAAETEGPRGLVVGGSLGGGAALIHLTRGAPGSPTGTR